MIWDKNARRVGDVVTIMLNETTNFQGQETRTLKKNTINQANAAMSGNFAEGKKLSHSLSRRPGEQLELRPRAERDARTCRATATWWTTWPCRWCR